MYPRIITFVIEWCNIHFMASYSYGIAMQTNLLDNGPFALDHLFLCLDVTLFLDILPRITFWVGAHWGVNMNGSLWKFLFITSLPYVPQTNLPCLISAL